MINEKITYKHPSNEKEIKANSQEVIIELNDSDYSIP